MARDDVLRYKFVRSSSKRFPQVLEIARGLPGFREDGNAYWIDLLPDTLLGNEFRELEHASKFWKGSGYFSGGEEILAEEWWKLANPCGKRHLANVEDDWKESRAFLSWGRPENLIVGESFRQDSLRQLARVGPTVFTALPVDVELSREPSNQVDPNAVKALVDGVQVGYLPADRAHVVAKGMDREGIQEMDVCGIMTGEEILGVHIWPYRLASNGIVVGDPVRAKPVRFEEITPAELDAYLAARTAESLYPPSSVPVTARDGTGLGGELHATHVAKAQAGQVGSGCLAVGGSVCLLFAAPLLLKHGINSNWGITFLIFGLFGLLTGIGAWLNET